MVGAIAELADRTTTTTATGDHDMTEPTSDRDIARKARATAKKARAKARNR